MTTPGGVPNLPQGALTIDTLAADTQDMTTPAMRSRAAARFPNIFNSSTGGNALNDLTPIGIITQIFSGFNSVVANADPADVQGPEDLPGMLLDFIESLPVVGELIGLLEAITGTYSGDDPVLLEVQTIFAPIRAIVDSLTGLSGGAGGLGSFFPDLLGLLGNPTGLGTGTTSVGSLNSIPILGPLIGGLLNGGQGVNTLNLFGQLPQSLFGLIPASAIGSVQPNLLNNGGFDGSISMDGSGVWTWDSTVGHTTTGSARATADGTLKALLSNAVDVTPGQVLSPSAWAKTASYAGTGTPIRLGVRTYLNGVQVSTATITSIAGPGSTWTQLSGSYTVPTSGVNQVRLRLIVDTTATAGSVWFDDATLTKPGNGPFNGILSLFGLTALEDLLGGSPTLPALGSIPILGPMFSLFGGATTATQATNFFTSITGLFGNPTGLLTGSPTVPALGSIPILGPVFSLFGGATTATGATNWVTDLLGVLGTPTSMGTGSPVVDTVGHIPIIGGLLDGLFGGLTNQSSSGATQTNVQAATASQSDTVAGQGSLITQIQAALGSGTPDADDFERSTLGSNWTFVSSSGTGTIPDSHNFHYSGTGSSAEYVMRKNDIVGSTDHITSSIVLNQAIPASFVSIPPYGGNVDVWVRMTAFTTYATRTGVRLRINSSSLAGSWSLDWVNAGTVTNLASGSCSIPAAGTIISLEAGASATPRRFLGTFNGSSMGCDFTDVSSVTTIGASNRYRGFGGKGTSGIGFAQGTPDIRQWTAQG